MSKILYTRSSTLNSLKGFKFIWDGSIPKEGDVIDLIHTVTGDIKKFKVETAKVLSGNSLVLQNMNNTILLKE